MRSRWCQAAKSNSLREPCPARFSCARDNDFALHHDPARRAGGSGQRTGKIRRHRLAQAAARFLGKRRKNTDARRVGRSLHSVSNKRYSEFAPNYFRFRARRFIPKWFAHVHPRFRTPDIAIVAYAAIGFALSFSSTFQRLAVLSNMAVLLLYILCCLAALELSRRDVRSDGAPFMFRGQSIVPVVGVIFIIWVLAHATRNEFAITAACLAAATLLFLIRKLAGTR